MKRNGTSSSLSSHRFLDVQVPVVARQGIGRKPFSKILSVAAILVAEKVEQREALIVSGD